MTPQQIDRDQAQLAEVTRERDRLREALKELYEETASYITVNKLGNIHHNRSMQLAHSALSARPEPKTHFINCVKYVNTEPKPEAPTGWFFSVLRALGVEVTLTEGKDRYRIGASGPLPPKC